MTLFSPLDLRGLSLRNRIGVSPMCQYSSIDGFADDWHLVHLGQFALGGAAVVFTEATAVAPEGRISPQDLGLWKDEHMEMLARIGSFVKRHDAVFGMQLAHAGRKASTKRPWEGQGPVATNGWSPIYAPSEIAFDAGWQTPVALDKNGITRVIDAFALATQRALDIGAQILELHAAHGYLLHEFLSPLSNARTDEYGGSFENRTRIVREVLSAMRRVLPDSFPISVRLSATDWAEGGWSVDETVELAKLLHADGADIIDCSSGGLVPGVRIPIGPGYQTQFAERIRRGASMPTAAVGLITSPHQADTIIRSGQADMVVLARELLRDPHWPLRAARELKVDWPWPNQYERAKL